MAVSITAVRRRRPATICDRGGSKKSEVKHDGCPSTDCIAPKAHPYIIGIMRNNLLGEVGWWLWLLGQFLKGTRPADNPSKGTLEAFAC